MIDVEAALDALASERPIFHSEADFQFALAWTIKRLHPTASVRMEYRPIAHKPIYLDIWVSLGTEALAIEVKYRPRSFGAKVGDEQFSLVAHGAYPQGRYDCVKDLSRLEKVVQARHNTDGYLISLTNDPAYWTPPRVGAHIRTTTDAAFRLHEGRVLEGRLDWKQGTGDGTKKGREQPIVLARAFQMHWHHYSQILGAKPEIFQSLVVHVRPNRREK